MMKDLGIPMEYCEAHGLMLPVVDIRIKYLLPAKLGDTLKVITNFVKYPQAKIFIEQEIYNQKGEKLCFGSVTLGAIDSVTRRPIPVPQFMLEKLSPYFSDDEKK